MKRYFALILAALLLMPTIVSCSQNGSEETKGAETTADTAATADSEAETDDGNIRSWEGLTFDGAEINIVGRTEATYAIDFYAEEITGEAVNDAVYNRNSKVDNDLAVQLNYINGPDDYNTFFTNVRNSVSILRMVFIASRVNHGIFQQSFACFHTTFLVLPFL